MPPSRGRSTVCSVIITAVSGKAEVSREGVGISGEDSESVSKSVWEPESGSEKEPGDPDISEELEDVGSGKLRKGMGNRPPYISGMSR